MERCAWWVPGHKSAPRSPIHPGRTNSGGSVTRQNAEAERRSSYAIVNEYFRNAQREHRAMLKAIRNGDRRTLIELYARHLDISRNAYVHTQRLRSADGSQVTTG
jgi:DNA-binding FadR family transcriptional regulator